MTLLLAVLLALFGVFVAAYRVVLLKPHLWAHTFLPVLTGPQHGCDGRDQLRRDPSVLLQEAVTFILLLIQVDARSPFFQHLFALHLLLPLSLSLFSPLLLHLRLVLQRLDVIFKDLVLD